MSKRFWLATGSMLAMYGFVSGAGCLVVSDKGGTGGATSASSTTTVTPMSSNSSSSTGAGVTSSSTAAMSSSSTGPCNETGSVHCSHCVTAFDCGVAATNTTVLGCNNVAMSGKSSYDLYTNLYDCLCGTDGGSGACGASCSKTCKGTGTDAGNCQQCVGVAFTSATKCKSTYDACKAD